MRTAGAFPGAGFGKIPTHKGLTLPAEILTPEELLAILDECRARPRASETALSSP